MSALAKRPAALIAREFADHQIANLEWLIAGLRDGSLIVEQAEIADSVAQLPPRADEEWMVHASSGVYSYTIKVRAPATQRRYAEQMLERL